jgi:hypothetical protein
MIATNVRSVPLLTNQILTEKLGQGIEGVVHARESGRFCHTVRGGIAEGNVAHALGNLGVNLVPRVICCIITKSLTEISICAIALLRASHPSHIAVLIEIDGAVELANDIGVVVILESCNLKNTELLHAFINKVKIIMNVIVLVRHVKCMLMHNPAPLEVCLVIVVVIPHLLLTFSPEQLVTSNIGPLLEMVRITETKCPPLLSMHGAKAAFRNLFWLFGIRRSLFATG